MKHVNTIELFKSKLICWSVALLIFIVPEGLWAQVTTSVSGSVKDSSGLPLVGATVVVMGTSNGVTTGVDGVFTLNCDPNAKLQISFIGYQPVVVEVNGRSRLTINMSEDATNLDEIVVVGYGVQKKATLTGAVAAVDNSQLVTTKTQNVQNMLTGKIPGVRVVQRTSEPGSDNLKFDIRGFGSPLVVIDGVPRDNILSSLDPNDIESISVLKDASAAIYGVRAANGVVLVTTKKGRKGRFTLEYQTYYGFQFPSNLPETVGVVDRMILLNEKNRNKFTIDQATFVPTYTEAEIEEYRNGTKTGYDWKSVVIQNAAPQYQHNISASGGSDRINYYFNLGYMYQEGFFKSKSLNYRRYNVSSNINAQISKRLSTSLKLSGIMGERQAPSYSVNQAFKSWWRASPNNSIYANDNPDYLAKAGTQTNVIAVISRDISGYNDRNTKNLDAVFEVNYDVPYIDGLKAKAMFSYDIEINDLTSFRKGYEVYTYDAANDEYTPNPYNYPNQLTRTYESRPSTLMQYSLNYNNSFKNHNISALVAYEETSQSMDNFYALRELGLPIDNLVVGIDEGQQGYLDTDDIWEEARKAVIGKINYDYKSKYIAEFSFRYDGSSKFPKGKQWGFFPAVSVGWRISEEKFIKNSDIFSFVDNLKLRASYGVMGDDAAAAYQFVTGYDYPYAGSATGLPSGSVFDGTFVSSLGFRNLPNMDISWYKVKTANVGLDANLWNGLLGFSIDLFRRDRTGLLATRALSIPQTVGATLPQENLNADRDMGFEILLTHRNRIGNDFSYNVEANFSYTRSQYISYDSAPFGNSIDYWRNALEGRYKNIWWGYGGESQYQSWEQIINSPVFVSKETIPGDYIYEDYNGDGIINSEDYYPICTNDIPKAYFGLNIGLTYKNIDLSMLFQGAAVAYVSYNEMFNEPLMWSGNALTQFLDRWHPVDPNADPFDPNTEWISGEYAYTGVKKNLNSRHSANNAAYLRLKSIELGYSFPSSILNKIGIKKARVFVNCYNLLTISGLKVADPEHPSDEYGYIYPLNKTLNFGINLTF